MVVALLNLIREKSQVTFSRSSGAGGQNVNKVNTRVQLTLDLKFLEEYLASRLFMRLKEKLKNRINQENQLQIAVQDHRTQGENLTLAYQRLSILIQGALVEPKIRRPTKASRGGQERRLESKRLRGMVKRQRNQLD